MKLVIFVFTTILALTSCKNQQVSANLATTSLKVYGNCEMCKERIEKAVTSVKGVKSATWNVDTKILRVTYHPDIANETMFHQACTQVGHDTDKMKTSGKTYDNLHGCCKYDRTED